MSIALLQEKIRARKTPLALVLGPEADKLPARITKNFTDMYGPGDMAQAEALRYHGSQLISQTAPLLPAVVLQAERYLRYGFMGMDVLANLVNMAKAQGLYTIVDARSRRPGGVCGGRHPGRRRYRDPLSRQRRVRVGGGQVRVCRRPHRQPLRPGDPESAVR